MTVAYRSNFTHYGDVIKGAIASQITSLTIVYSTVYSDADQRKHHSFASLAFVWGIHRGPVNSPHKGPVTRKMFPFDDVIMGKISILDMSLMNINLRLQPHLPGANELRKCVGYRPPFISQPKIVRRIKWGLNKMAGLLQTTFSNTFWCITFWFFRLQWISSQMTQNDADSGSRMLLTTINFLVGRLVSATVKISQRCLSSLNACDDNAI